MNNKPYFRFKLAPAAAISFALLLTICFTSPAAKAVDVPQWLRDAAQQSAAPGAPPNGDANAVILFDDQETNVKDNGEIETMHRRAFLILRPGGKSAGVLNVPFDPQMKITSIHGWCIPKTGKEFEVKDKDAMELNFDEEFYSDVRHRVLEIPAALPGNIVAYEYRQKSRPFILQDEWWFQDELPMRRSIFTVNLPPGWKFKSYWMHYPEQSPKVETASEMQWEVDNVPAMKEERGMPAWRGVAGEWASPTCPPQVPPLSDHPTGPKSASGSKASQQVPSRLLPKFSSA